MSTPSANWTGIREEPTEAYRMPRGKVSASAARALLPPRVAKSSRSWLYRYESLLPFGVLLVAIFTRFYRISQPAGVAFDELHFGKFAGWAMKHWFQFDIHPPLAKLALAFGGFLLGYDPDKCDYEPPAHASRLYAQDCEYYKLRGISAAFSCATCVLQYLVARRFGASPGGALLASSFVLFDMLNLIEGRLILLNTQLCFWLTLSLYSAQRWWARQNAEAAGLGAPRVSAGISGAAVTSAEDATPVGGATALLGSVLGWSEGAAAAGGAARRAALLRRKHKDSDADVGQDESVVDGEEDEDSATSEEEDAAVNGAAGAAGSSDKGGALASCSAPAGGPMKWPERIAWAVWLGFCCGNCISVKHTGLATPGMIALETCMAVFFLALPSRWVDMTIVGASAVLTYAGWFAVHFWNFRYSHGHDPEGRLAKDGMWRPLRQEEEFMSTNFQETLEGAKIYNPDAKFTDGFWWTFWTLNKRMIAHSAAITQPHAWGTRPLEWITNSRGVSYWGSTMGGAEDGVAVYYIGNPLAIWLVLAVLLIVVVFFGLAQRARSTGKPGRRGLVAEAFLDFWRPLGAPLSFCLCGYIFNLLPYIAIERTTFLYHYLPALMYGELATSLFLDRLLGPRWAARFCLVLAAGWLYWWPWIYGTPLSNEGHAARRWMPRWN